MQLMCSQCGEKTSIFKILFQYTKKYCSSCQEHVKLRFNNKRFVHDSLLWLVVGEIFLYIVAPHFLMNIICLIIFPLFVLLNNFELRSTITKENIFNKELSFPRRDREVKIMIALFSVTIGIFIVILLYGIGMAATVQGVSFRGTIGMFVLITAAYLTIYAVFMGYSEMRVFYLLYNIVNVPIIISIAKAVFSGDFLHGLINIVNLIPGALGWITLILMFLPQNNKWLEACRLYRFSQINN